MKERIKASLRGLRDLIRNNKRLTKLTWKYSRGLLFATVITSLFMAVLPFLRSGVFAVLINDLVKSLSTGDSISLSSHVIALLGLAVTVSVLPQFFFVVKNLVDRRLWFVLSEKFELMYIKKQGEIDVATYENPKFNDLLSKARDRSIYPMSNLLQGQFENLQNIIGVGVASAILISVNWKLFAILFVGSIPKFVVELIYGRMVWGIFDANAETRRRYYDSKHHFEWLPYLTELKIFQSVGYFFGIIEKLMMSFNKEQVKAERKKFLNQLLALSVSMSTEAVALTILILSVIHRNVDIGTMTFVIASMYELQNAFSGFFMSVAGQYKDSLFVTDILKILDTKPVIKKPDPGIVIDGSVTPEIEFQNVSFSYPGTARLILKNLSLKIDRGQKLALVGVNGSGKTTIVKLICRFYDPTEGRILINGYDLRDIDLESLYHLMSVLFQDFATYNFPVKQSIAMGRPSDTIDMEKVVKAAQISESDTFIKEWSHGYDQMIGKEFSDGLDPSKGQMQKLALARTFYRDPKFLILDEPTASIDAEAEAKIFERLESLPQDRTMILISHRFSTVRKADKICVISEGKITELGSHCELIAQKGTYARLFSLQAAGYRD